MSYCTYDNRLHIYCKDLFRIFPHNRTRSDWLRTTAVVTIVTQSENSKVKRNVPCFSLVDNDVRHPSWYLSKWLRGFNFKVTRNENKSRREWRGLKLRNSWHQFRNSEENVNRNEELRTIGFSRDCKEGVSSYQSFNSSKEREDGVVRLHIGQLQF